MVDLFAEYLPNYDIPKRNMFSQNLLPELYIVMKKFIIAFIHREAPQTVGLSFDFWTDGHTGNKYIGSTLHLVDLNCETRCILLSFDRFYDSQTADKIRDKINELIADFQLESYIIYDITDNGSNCIAASRKLNHKRLPCFAHALHNLLTTDGISKNPAITALITKCKSIYTFMRYKKSQLDKAFSDLYEANFHAIADELILDEEIPFSDHDCLEEHSYFSATNLTGKGPTRIKNSVPTRWNSILGMIRSILNNFDVIHSVCFNNDGQDLQLSFVEKQTLAELRDFLAVFETATTAFSKTNSPSINQVIIVKETILKKLNQVYKQESINQLKESIKQRLDARLNILDEHKLAALLDFRIKNTNLLNKFIGYADPVTLILDNIYNFVKNDNQEVSGNQEDTQEPSIYKDLANLGGVITCSSGTESDSRLKAEVNAYLNHQGGTSFENPLDWWKKNAHLYPNLIKLVRSIYSLPASSTGPERLFSMSRRTINELRSCLSANTAKYSLFIKHNYSFVKMIKHEIANDLDNLLKTLYSQTNEELFDNN